MKQISEKELEVRVAALAAMSPFELREEWARVWGPFEYEVSIFEIIGNHLIYPL